MINRARAIARIAHAGQKYGCEDYFTKHILDVASRVVGAANATNDHIIVAYLHDTVEDTSVTLADLSAFGFSDEIIAAIDAISRKDGEQYLDYIERCKKNDLAAFVKYHDLKSNANDDTPIWMAARNAKAVEMLS